MLQLDDPITVLPGIGESTASKLSKLGLSTVRDILLTLPRDYLDYSQSVKIADLLEDKKQGFVAEIVTVKNIFLRSKFGKGGGRTMQRVMLRDETATVEAIWFNAPYIEDSLIPNEQYAFIAKLTRSPKTGKLLINAPIFEKLGPKMIHTQGIVPIYKLTKGISPKVYRRLLAMAIEKLERIPELDYQFPEESLINFTEQSGRMFTRREALQQAHFPTSWETLKQAKQRLSIEELLPIVLALEAERRERIASKCSVPVWKTTNPSNDYWQKYDFEPTADQKTTVTDIYNDFTSGIPEYRLVQGDVGSGKTAIAGFAIYLTLLSGKDAVIMAPTTVLAEQHFEKLQQIFPDQVELIISETKKDESSSTINKNHKPKLYVGTQAILFRKQQLLQNLGLVVVDEEHRFGVKQREEISEFIHHGLPNNTLPHYLTLTATPIPRTLARTIFGNIEISIIKSLPKNRRPRHSYIVPEIKRPDSYDWIKENIDKGNLVFWVCPLIEATKEAEGLTYIVGADEKASVTETATKLTEIFPDYPIATFHGKLKQKEKSSLLTDFRAGKYKILVCTTVIEVGIDIPEANIMVIENAENFGLAQLHQLRGRIGRGTEQGYCFLYTQNIQAQERLQLFCKTEDGLQLAEYDLRDRGPGEVYGTVQSGIPNLKVANLLDNRQVKIATQIVTDLLELNQENPGKYRFVPLFNL